MPTIAESCATCVLPRAAGCVSYPHLIPYKLLYLISTLPILHNKAMYDRPIEHIFAPTDQALQAAEAMHEAEAREIAQQYDSTSEYQVRIEEFDREDTEETIELSKIDLREWLHRRFHVDGCRVQVLLNDNEVLSGTRSGLEKMMEGLEG